MSQSDPGSGVNRLRAIASRLAGRIGGLPAVRTLTATLAAYDGAGGGLIAGGLAYAALVATLPLLLLVLSVVGLLIDDPLIREDLVATISTVLPPLGPPAEVALTQVAAGAAPTSILAVVGLVWASSRFYASLDNAFSRVFATAPRRNEVDRAVRGVGATLLLVAVPFAALAVGAVASWMLDLAPASVEVSGPARTVWQLSAPILSLVAFTGASALAYRLVPTVHPPLGALGLPAIVVGVVLTAFTALFTLLAPRLVGVAALYGTFVAAFALLAWLSIAFNVVLLGAAWTHVRAEARAGGQAGTSPARS